MKKNQTFVRCLDLETERGISKNCQICFKKFGTLNKEHQCKRCKRPICDNCGQHKMIILSYKIKPKVPHRVCNLCKEEVDDMKKFIEENKIQFESDTLGLEWLAQFGMNQESARNSYKKAEVKDQSEFNMMKGQLQQVFEEIEQNYNYSLRQFFSIVLNVDRQNILSIVERVLGTFLLNYPQVGYSADQILITLFLLCFSSEASTYSLLELLYVDIFPNYLYSTAQRLKEYEFKTEIGQVTKLAQALKINIEPMKLFLQSIKHYVLTLTLNLLSFESSLFIISNIFVQDGYDELVRCLAATLGLMDPATVNPANILTQILWNTKRKNLQDLYYRAKKFRADSTQVQRSLSIVQQREGELKMQNDLLRQDLTTSQKTLAVQKITIEELQDRIKNLTSANKEFEAQQQKLQVKTAALQEENAQLLEQNHNLKLQNMQLESSKLQENNNNNSRLETTSKTFENSNLEEKEYQSQIQQLQADKSQLEMEIQKLKQELEMSKLQSANPSQLSQLLQIKNNTINQQNQEIQQLKTTIAELQKEQNQSMNSSSHRRASLIEVNNVIKDLEDGKVLLDKKNQEILLLKKQISELKEEKLAQPQIVKQSSDDQTRPQSLINEKEVSEDLLLLLSDPDPNKRIAARNIKQQIMMLQEELIFQRTQAEIKKEQLQPYKSRAESLQKQLDFIVEQNKELQIDIEQKRDQLNEFQLSKGRSIQARIPVREVDVRRGNGGCTDGKDCKIF